MQFMGNLLVEFRQLHELDDLFFAKGEFLNRRDFRDFTLPAYPARCADALVATRPKFPPAPKTTLQGWRRKKILTYWHTYPFFVECATSNLETTLIGFTGKAFRHFEVRVVRIFTL
jgi:hypothetical protein